MTFNLLFTNRTESFYIFNSLLLIRGYEVDVDSARCGTSGCTYLLKGEHVGKRIKIGEIDSVEVSFAKRLSAEKIGVEVYDTFEEIELISVDETQPNKIGAAIVMQSYEGTLSAMRIDEKSKLNALQLLFNKAIRFGIKHGDLKDNNVVYRVNRGVYEFRFIDFGESKFLDLQPMETRYVKTLEIISDWFIVLSFFDEAMRLAKEGQLADEAIRLAKESDRPARREEKKLFF
jgi:hypothetical protein